MESPITGTETGRTVQLVGIVLIVHLVVEIIHTNAHLEIPVLFDTVLNTLIILMYYVLPVLGFVLLWRGSVKLGLVIFTVSMAISFALGTYLHFLVPNPDHVSSIPSGPWQLPFQLTAVALAVTDAVGTALGVWMWPTLDSTVGQQSSQVRQR